MSLAECLARLAELTERMPMFLVPVITIGSSDCEGDYGWHRFVDIEIFEEDTVCEKCGYSKIHGGNDEAHPAGRHRWRGKEKTVFLSKAHFNFEELISNLEKFINEYKI